jgi:hypothetical protein
VIANRYLLMHKFMRIIEKYAEEADISLRTALDTFYKSILFIEMNEGISDMHCRSDDYLVEELQSETNGRIINPQK